MMQDISIADVIDLCGKASKRWAGDPSEANGVLMIESLIPQAQMLAVESVRALLDGFIASFLDLHGYTDLADSYLLALDQLDMLE